jgi:hypothetical protein
MPGGGEDENRPEPTGAASPLVGDDIDRGSGAGDEGSDDDGGGSLSSASENSTSTSAKKKKKKRKKKKVRRLASSCLELLDGWMEKEGEGRRAKERERERETATARDDERESTLLLSGGEAALGFPPFSSPRSYPLKKTTATEQAPGRRWRCSSRRRRRRSSSNTRSSS